MKRWLPYGLLLLAAADKLPPPDDTAHLPQLTAGEQTAQDMILAYQQFCLTAFPDQAALAAALAAGHAAPAGPAESAEGLQGRAGRAWAIAGPRSERFTLTLTDAPHADCAVSGLAQDDDNMRGIFDVLVRRFAAEARLGRLDSLADEGGRLLQPPPEAVQALLAVTAAPQQGFSNAARRNPDGTTRVRLTRSIAGR